MQSIAEEVVSSSGGGGTYITSGFSNYVGHSAIGFGWGHFKSDVGSIYEGTAIAIGEISSSIHKGNGVGIIGLGIAPTLSYITQTTEGRYTSDPYFLLQTDVSEGVDYVGAIVF